jgi:hypothetical protein
MWSSRAPMHSRYSIRDEAAQQSESRHQCVTQYWRRYLTTDFQSDWAGLAMDVPWRRTYEAE